MEEIEGEKAEPNIITNLRAIQILSLYIKHKLNICISGDIGIGKLTCVKEAIKAAKIKNYKLLDCIECYSESLFCAHISQLFKIQGKPETSLYLLKDDILHSMRGENEKVYLILHHTQYIVQKKVFRRLLDLAQQIEPILNIVLIINGLENEVTWFDDLLLSKSEFVHIKIHSPTKEQMINILKGCIAENGYIEKLPHYYPECFNTLFDIIWNTFSKYTNSINEFKYIAKLLTPNYFHPLLEDKDHLIDRNSGTLFSKLHNDKFRKAMGVLRDNLFMNALNPLTLDQEMATKDDEDFKKQVQNSLKKETNSYAIRDHNYLEKVSLQGFTFVEACILLAAYVASFSAEASDFMLFKYAKGKKKRKKTKEGSVMIAKKFKMDRLIAITDYFLSLNENIEGDPNTCADATPFTSPLTNTMERKTMGHTVEFYGLVNNLINQGYIKRYVGKVEDPNLIHLKVNVDFQFVEEVAESIEFPIYDYLLTPEQLIIIKLLENIL